MTAGEVLATFALDMKSVDRAMGQLKTRFSAMASALSGLGLTAMVTRPLVQAAKEIARTGSEFEAEMSRVGAVMNLEGLGMSAEEAEKAMASLRETALRMGESTSLSASEAAQAMENLAMAGWKSADIGKAIEPLIRLSEVAGSGSLQDAASIVADTLTSLQLGSSEAGHLADVLTATATGSNTDLMKLGMTFKYVANMAGNLGFSMEDLALASGLMANAGIKAQKAGTGLRAMLNNMSSSKKARDMMAELGISLYDAEGRAYSLRKVIVDLRAAMSGLTQEERTAAAYALAGTGGMNAVLSLVNATEESFQSLAAAVDDSSGAAVRASRTMLDNLKGDLVLLQSALDTTKIQLMSGMEGTFRKMTQTAADLVRMFNGLGAGEQKAFLRLGAMAAAIGPALTALAALKPALLSLVPALTGLVSPAGLVMTGLAGIGMAALSADGDIGAFLEKTARQFPEWAGTARQAVQDLTGHIRQELPEVLDGLGRILREGTAQSVSLLAGAGTELARILGEQMPAVRETAMNLVRGFAESIRQAGPEMVQAVGKLFAELAGSAMQSAPELMRMGMQVMQAFADGLKSLPMEDILSGLAGKFRKMLAGMAEAVRELGPALLSTFGQILADVVREIPALDWAGIGNALMDMLKSTASVLAQGVRELGGKVARAVTEGFSLFSLQDLPVEGLVSDALSRLSGAVESGLKRLPETLKGLQDMCQRVLEGAAEVLAEGMAALEKQLSALDLGPALEKGMSGLDPSAFLRSLQEALGKILPEAGKILGDNIRKLTEAVQSMMRGILTWDLEDMGRSAARWASSLADMLMQALQHMDIGKVTESLLSALGNGLEGLGRLGSGILEEILRACTDPAALAKFRDAGLSLVRSLMEGILNGMGQLASSLVNAVSRLLQPVMKILTGIDSENRTQEITLFRNARIRVSPDLFEQAEMTGREIEEKLARLLSLGGIQTEKDLDMVVSLRKSMEEAGYEAMAGLEEGLSRYAPGMAAVFRDVLQGLEGQEEEAGQKAALMYMAGFQKEIQGLYAGENGAWLQEMVQKGAAEIDLDGYVDLEKAAQKLGLKLQEVLGTEVPKGYRLAFNGMAAELQEITGDSIRTVAESMDIEGLLGSGQVWEEAMRTSLSFLGDLAPQMAKELEKMGMNAMDVLGMEFGTEMQQQLRAALSQGDTENAGSLVRSMLGLDSIRQELESGMQSVQETWKNGVEEMAQAADPKDAMSNLFRSAGEEAVTAARDALTEGAPEVEQAGSEVSAAAVEAFARTMTGEEGRKVAQAFLNGLKGAMSMQKQGLAALAGTVGQGIRQVLSETLSISAGAGIGQRFMQGLASGLRSGMQSVQSAARSAAGLVSSTTKTVLQVRSPSRVAMEIGRMYTEGLRLGLLEPVQSLKRAVRDLSEAVRPELGEPFSRELDLLGRDLHRGDAEEKNTEPGQILAAVREGIGQWASAMAGVHVEMDGEAVGRLVTPAVSRQIAWNVRSGRYER